jgi:5-methylcytosine-specific restriction enzyme subunit McrC
MREITLEEHRPKTEALAADEAEQILATGLVDAKPLFGEGLYELKAGSKVGTAVLPSLRLLIRPKVGLRNLFFLLAYGAGLTRWAADRFPYEEEELDLFEAVARVFEAEVGRAMARGFVCGYQPRRETLSTLRGRIDVAGQVRVRQGRPFPLKCSFEEYTEDVEPNRMVKAALRRLLRTPGLGGDVVRALRFRYRDFDGVASMEYAPGAVPEVEFNRLNEHWEAAGMLARLILQQESLRDEIGSVLGISFTVDMNRLFERFVERVLAGEIRRSPWQLVPQARRFLAAGVPMTPDLVLRDGRGDAAVGDAKYKELGGERPPPEDLYQLLAYCVSLGLPSGLLIYADERPPGGPYVVERAGVTLEAAGIDLTGDPAGVLVRARGTARRLIRQAERSRAATGSGLAS